LGELLSLSDAAVNGEYDPEEAAAIKQAVRDGTDAR
jgi:hypothetical protein